MALGTRSDATNNYDFIHHLDQPLPKPLVDHLMDRQAHVGIRPEPLTLRLIHLLLHASSDRLLTTSSITSYLAWVVGTCVSLGLQCLVPEVLTQGPKLGEQNKG